MRERNRWRVNLTVDDLPTLYQNGVAGGGRQVGQRAGRIKAGGQSPSRNQEGRKQREHQDRRGRTRTSRRERPGKSHAPKTNVTNGASVESRSSRFTPDLGHSASC